MTASRTGYRVEWRSVADGRAVWPTRRISARADADPAIVKQWALAAEGDACDGEFRVSRTGPDGLRLVYTRARLIEAWDVRREPLPEPHPRSMWLAEVRDETRRARAARRVRRAVLDAIGEGVLHPDEADLLVAGFDACLLARTACTDGVHAG